MKTNPIFYYGPYVILTAFFAYLLYVVNKQVLINTTYENGYTLGDWLINYEDGGFKRRGLSGSFFIWLFDNFKLPIKKTVYLFQMVFYAVFAVSYLRLVFIKKISWAYIGLALSTCTFLFFLYELGSIGRKEVILFATYAFFLNLLSFRKINSNIIWVYLLVTVPLGILFHELYFFYLPFFAIPLFLNKEIITPKKFSSIFLSIGAIAIGIVLALKLWGGEINQGNTFKILMERGVGESMQNLGNMGILTWNDNFDKGDFFVLAKYYLYGISFAIGSLLFFFYNSLERVFQPSTFWLLLLGTLILTSPIYLMAIDWGRWINIHFVMMLLLLTYSVKQTKDKPMNYQKKVIYFLILCLVLAIFWCFDLVDNGFYFNRF